MQSHQEINLRSLALREAALTPGEDRDRLYEEHPLVLNAICIPTGPVQEAYDIVRQVLVHRDPGTCLTADFRIGKTTAIHAITRQLSRTTPDVPFGFVIVKGHDKPTERNFFTDILLDFKHRAATSGTTTDRRTRVLSTMLSQAMQKKSTRYLLLVDEGQNWGESEFTFLRDLTNDCQERNLAVITVIFGHPALKQIRAHLVGKARMDLVARFLLTPRVFRGIQDKEDFLATFRAHDDAGLLEFPRTVASAIRNFSFLKPGAPVGDSSMKAIKRGTLFVLSAATLAGMKEYWDELDCWRDPQLFLLAGRKRLARLHGLPQRLARCRGRKRLRGQPGGVAMTPETILSGLVDYRRWARTYEGPYSRACKLGVLNVLGADNLCRMLFGRGLLTSHAKPLHGRSLLGGAWLRETGKQHQARVLRGHQFARQDVRPLGAMDRLRCEGAILSRMHARWVSVRGPPDRWPEYLPAAWLSPPRHLPGLRAPDATIRRHACDPRYPAVLQQVRQPLLQGLGG